VVLQTDRLVLRGWRATDRIPLAAMNADPVVMEHYVAPLTEAESSEFVDRVERHYDVHGWGLWAVELAATGSFIGHVGLTLATFDAPFTPAVEVGWRLDREHWGHGYATEAARASLDHGFTVLGLDEIVSFTTPRNIRSQRVMEKLGMTRDRADDFEHPNVPVGHPLRPHVLYRLAAPAPREC
jgi:RimJ/RimL family protein N-acetyltransferase